MTKSRMMSGSSILTGNNTVPGIKIHKEVGAVLPQIESACRKMGLEYRPIIVEFVRYDEMAELASYGGFPVRYPHWRFGMEYEEMARGYEHNQYRISELVINTLVDNVDVIAHAIGHNDFFNNNIFFEPTDENMMNKLANHGTRIRKYMARWGQEVVTEFIDHCLRLDTLIDPNKAWYKKKIKEAVVRDEREYRYPDRLSSHHNYMDEWVNPKNYIKEQNQDIKKEEAANFLDIFNGSHKDILGFLKDNAPLKPWQQDIISMLYDEAMYFSPQRSTKMTNEGWASFVDYHILCRMGLVSLGQKTEDAGIWHYAEHKMRVLGGKYSQNPYKLGFELLLDIEDRWNKGKFGSEYENCKDMHKKENWDLKLGLGMEKLFEVRKNYNDFLMIQEFFTPEFCEKKQFFEWKLFPNEEYKIVNKDFKSIKKKMLQKYMNGGLPDIRLLDSNHLGKGWLYMEHKWDGRPLHDQYARETIISISKLWKNNVVLSTKNIDGVEYVYLCDGGAQPDKSVQIITRHEYEITYRIVHDPKESDSIRNTEL